MATVDLHPIAGLYGCTDAKDPNTFYAEFNHGVIYLPGGKAVLRRPVASFYVQAYADWDLTDAVLRANVDYILNGGFPCTLRRIVESYEAGFTWNDRGPSLPDWTNAGPSPPTSATDTGKVSYTAPTTPGEQTIVSGLLDLVQDAIQNRSGYLRIVMQNDDENPGSDRYFTTAYGNWQNCWLRLTGTPPATAPIMGPRKYW